MFKSPVDKLTLGATVLPSGTERLQGGNGLTTVIRSDDELINSSTSEGEAEIAEENNDVSLFSTIPIETTTSVNNSTTLIGGENVAQVVTPSVFQNRTHSSQQDHALSVI